MTLLKKIERILLSEVGETIKWLMLITLVFVVLRFQGNTHYSNLTFVSVYALVPLMVIRTIFKYWIKNKEAVSLCALFIAVLNALITSEVLYGLSGILRTFTISLELLIELAFCVDYTKWMRKYIIFLAVIIVLVYCEIDARW